MARKEAVSLQLRIPPSAKAWLEKRAEADWATVNAVVVKLLRAAMAAEEQARTGGYNR